MLKYRYRVQNVLSYYLHICTMDCMSKDFGEVQPLREPLFHQDGAKEAIKQYLTEHVEEFRRLDKLRAKVGCRLVTDLDVESFRFESDCSRDG